MAGVKLDDDEPEVVQKAPAAAAVASKPNQVSGQAAAPYSTFSLTAGLSRQLRQLTRLSLIVRRTFGRYVPGRERVEGRW